MYVKVTLEQILTMTLKFGLNIDEKTPWREVGLPLITHVGSNYMDTSIQYVRSD